MPAGLPVFQLPTWYDVDDADALRVLIGELVDGKPFRALGGEATAATWTRSCLSELLESGDLAQRVGRAQHSTRVA